MLVNSRGSLANTAVLLLSIFEVASSSQPQSVLADNSNVLPKVHVNGRNSAYYTQVPKEEQLFAVRYLVAYPDTPAVNEHVFVYLYGHIEYEYPGLEDATLKMSGACPEYGEEENKITEWKQPVVRHGTEYGGPLTMGPNEMLFDSLMLMWPPFKPGKWNCSVEVTTRLPEPDSRILFSFAQNFTLEWPKPHDGLSWEEAVGGEMLQGKTSS